MTEPRDDLVRYRLERAAETLDEAHILADAERWPGTVNRLYYACFYAVSAVLLKQGMSSSKHTGIRSFFNLHFVKTGRVPPQLGKLYNELFTQRQEGDYVDSTSFDAEDVRPWLALAEEFLEKMTALSMEDSTRDFAG